MSEQERREAAYAHRGEVVEGSAVSVEPRRLGQVVSIRFEPEVLATLREIADRRGVTVSDLLREGAGMVILANSGAMQITDMSFDVSVAPISPAASWDPRTYTTSNPIRMPDDLSPSS